MVFAANYAFLRKQVCVAMHFCSTAVESMYTVAVAFLTTLSTGGCSDWHRGQMERLLIFRTRVIFPAIGMLCSLINIGLF